MSGRAWLKEAYERRDAPEIAARYAWWRPEVQRMRAGVTRALATLLGPTRAARLATARVLDVGCGTGDWLLRLVEWGVDPRRCLAVDLLWPRLQCARERTARGVSLMMASGGRLPLAGGSVDVVWMSTVLSSVLSDGDRRAIAAEILRVLAPGGVALIYDFRYPNPSNPDVRALTRREVRSCFAGCRLRRRTLTLAPPVSRRIGRWRFLSALIEVCCPFLRSHALYLVEKSHVD